MKILISSARNFRLNLVHNQVVPEIEAVLTVYGRHIDFVGAGMTQIERCETIRFTMSAEQARELSKHFLEWADEAEKQAARLEVKKD